MNLRRPRPFTFLILLHLLLVAGAVALLIKQGRFSEPSNDEIVVIPIHGVISGDEDLGKDLSVDDVVDTINDSRDDDNVKAIVLDIDSPGGSVGAVQQIYGALMKFRSENKFVVASFGDMGASGGYYIASAADRIVAQPGSLTGSIGVVMELPNVQGLLNKVGVSMQVVKSGEMKDAGSPFRAMTDQERGYFHDIILDAYDQFFEAVRLGRRIPAADLHPIADGRVFSGRMALEHKLVDELGGLEDAIDDAKKLAGLEDKEPTITYHEGRPSLQRILNLFSKSPIDKIPLMGQKSSTRLLYELP